MRLFLFKVLAKCKKICYHYDTVGKVLGNVVYDLCTGNEIASSMFSYDMAGNMALINSQYDRHNKLISFNGRTLSYDYDGNLTNNGQYSFTYDSSNRLTGVEYHSYTYNAEDVRIRMICECGDTTYTYNTNCKLSQLLTKTTDSITTKYVYGNGLIGEETCCDFLTYHFDNRGSTVAVTDECGNITDTFEYSTYGKCVSRTGENDIIFGYNGRDGVITDSNGLLYMRARYYSPEMGRFINADIIPGEITNAITLNRYAFANGNPVSFVDPLGLAVQFRPNLFSQKSNSEGVSGIGATSNSTSTSLSKSDNSELDQERAELENSLREIFDGIHYTTQLNNAYVEAVQTISKAHHLFELEVSTEITLFETNNTKVYVEVGAKLNADDVANEKLSNSIYHRDPAKRIRTTYELEPTSITQKTKIGDNTEISVKYQSNSPRHSIIYDVTHTNDNNDSVNFTVGIEHEFDSPPNLSAIPHSSTNTGVQSSTNISNYSAFNEPLPQGGLVVIGVFFGIGPIGGALERCLNEQSTPAYP